MENGFTTEGFPSFPNTYEDNKRLAEVTGLSREVLEAKATQYTRFLQREDIQQRARQTAGRILNHLIFELACQDGVYDAQPVYNPVLTPEDARRLQERNLTPKLEDEQCNGI